MWLEYRCYLCVEEVYETMYPNPASVFSDLLVYEALDQLVNDMILNLDSRNNDVNEIYILNNIKQRFAELPLQISQFCHLT